MSKSERCALSWWWPYKAAGPLLVAWGAAFPLLLRYIEWREVSHTDWVTTGVMITVGMLLIGYFDTKVVVDSSGVEKQVWFRQSRLEWSQMIELRIQQNSWVLFAADGRRLAVSTWLKNADQFASELDSRFTDAGKPRRA
jgi:hypothetical protein